jgi:hypothetical protein
MSAGSKGVPQMVSRLALVSACQLFIRREHNSALYLFPAFIAEALLYAVKVRPSATSLEKIKVRFSGMWF